MSEQNQVRGIIGGTVSLGRYVVNDYTLTISEIEDGCRLTIQRGSEVQTVDLRSLTPEEIAELRAAAEIVGESAEAAGEASSAAEALRGITFEINSDMEMEVTIPWQS